MKQRAFFTMMFVFFFITFFFISVVNAEELPLQKIWESRELNYEEAKAEVNVLKRYFSSNSTLDISHLSEFRINEETYSDRVIRQNSNDEQQTEDRYIVEVSQTMAYGILTKRSIFWNEVTKRHEAGGAFSFYANDNLMFNLVFEDNKYVYKIDISETGDFIYVFLLSLDFYEPENSLDFSEVKIYNSKGNLIYSPTSSAFQDLYKNGKGNTVYYFEIINDVKNLVSYNLNSETKYSFEIGFKYPRIVDINSLGYIIIRDGSEWRVLSPSLDLI